MKKYESTYFTAPDQSSDGVEIAIEDLGGKIIENLDLGLRSLAYQVEKLKEGRYSSIIFEIDNTKLMDLEKRVKQDKDVVRFILTTALRQSEIKDTPAETKTKPTVSTKPADSKEKKAEKSKKPEDKKQEKALPKTKKTSKKAPEDKQSDNKKPEKKKKVDKDLTKLDETLKELVKD